MTLLQLLETIAHIGIGYYLLTIMIYAAESAHRARSYNEAVRDGIQEY